MTRDPGRIVLELQTALLAVVTAEADSSGSLERAHAARARFLRRLAEILEPALPLLIDHGCETVLLFGDLWIDRGAGFYRGGSVGFNLEGPLSDQELGALRFDPVNVLGHLVDRLRLHATGRGAAARRIAAEVARFEALSALLAR